jgi:putative acetyltransferase
MLTIRCFDPTDANSLLKLFCYTVRAINSADYDSKQISAWASEEIDLDTWRERFAGRFAYVATLDEGYVGFADMTNEGYIDRLFVSARHQRQGIATALLARLKSEASNSGVTQLSTNASITAKPFFETAGFAVIRKQTVECRGVEFDIFYMVLRMH